MGLSCIVQGPAIQKVLSAAPMDGPSREHSFTFGCCILLVSGSMVMQHDVLWRRGSECSSFG